MPRSGGESDKLGNRYEGIWTVAQLLELAKGSFSGLKVEPIGEEAIGIEFVVRNTDETREYHSVKRQRTRGEWTLAELLREKKPGRSILGDLCDKLAKESANRCWFVSSTSANYLRELTERARLRKSFAEFQTDLDSKNSDRLRKEFENYFLPLVTDINTTYDYLQRLNVVLIDETTLTRQVELQIDYLVYRPDSREYSGAEVRTLLGDFILNHLGSEIRQGAVWKFLTENGYEKRDWTAKSTVREIVQKQIATYRRVVESDLINGSQIPRKETQLIVDAIRCENNAKIILASAAAGTGKSCILAQVVAGLERETVPVLVVRMDRYGDAKSTKDIGVQMGLPCSPSVVLAGLSNGRESVLMIDQLDAVSQVSGRYPHLWEVFDSLYREVAAYPNMRLVVACRDFDLQHDHRLRKLKDTKDVEHVAISLLSVYEVETAIKNSGRSAEKLSTREKEMLRIPLHLFLLLDSIGDDRDIEGFQNIGDLFDRYWERKERTVSERLGQKPDWIAVIDKLCGTMNRDFTVYVPSVILDEWKDTVSAMLTEHVLVRDDNQIRFFHESFFDYAFARRFCGTEQNLIEFLLSDEQHLFRRSQVRQILTFSRDHSRNLYLQQLREILNDERVRFHIKRLVFAWLGTLNDPTVEEWNIIEPLIENENLERHALPPIRNSLPWFDLLHSLGVIAGWLDSSLDKSIDLALWFLNFDQAQKSRSEVAAKLLNPYFERNSEWTNRLCDYFSYGNAHNSRPIQELFLKLIDNGSLAETSSNGYGNWWSRLHDAGKQAPLFVIEVIAHWIERRLKEATDPTGFDEHLFLEHRFDQSAERLIAEVARSEPSAYAVEFLPRILKIIQLSMIASDDGLRMDKVWGLRSNSEPIGIMESLLDELVKALETIASEDPDEFEKITSNLLETESDTIAFILLHVWSSHPELFGHECIRFLSDDARRLDVGYGSWSGGGTRQAAISREAIRVCLSHADKNERERLERAILGFSPAGEEGKFEGWTERLLLEAFGEENLSDTGRNRLIALREKFPEQEIEIPQRRSRNNGFVTSPIPSDETIEFSDDEWLDAMREYDYGWEERSYRHTMGKAVELSRDLQNEARLDRRRFSALCNRMENSKRPEYFEAILNGICGRENLSDEERKSDLEDFRQLETDIILGVIRRLHEIPNRPSGRSICGAFERLSDRTISDVDLQILIHYAVEDIDPAADDWKDDNPESKEDSSENVHVRGYNSVRGQAATAIGRLLFGDYSRAEILLPIIRRMVHDPSLAVRTCVVEALHPVFNHDRDEAVRLFLQVCDGAEEAFGAYPFGNFTRYASRTHYESIREVLQKALDATSPSAVTVAVRQICMAAFSDDAAEEDAEIVRNGSETMRCAAAEVYSRNLGSSDVSTRCQLHLHRFFSDKSEKVRIAAADCFTHLKEADFNDFTETIRTYIESPAYPSPHDILLRRLEESTWQLPEITIRLAEEFVKACGADAADFSKAAAGEAPSVSKLVIRLYSQTDDETIRTKCLDLIDEMERLAFYGIDQQLTEHDR